MTHVLMTADPIGGVWTYALELADALAPRGVTVSLATMGAALRDDQRRDVEASAVVDLHESTFALEWMDEPWGDVDAAGEWLLALERSVVPDMIHLNGYCHAGLPWRAPTVVVAHSCVVSWWDAVMGIAAPSTWDEYRRRVTEGLTAAGAVVAPSQAMLSALHRAYRCPDGMVVPNCRRADWVPADRAHAKEPLVVSVGRVWDRAKNVAAVVRCADSGAIPWPVVIVGGARHPDGAAMAAATSDNVEFMGTVAFADIARLLNRASIFMLPARYEPFGLAALEAGLAGCALILGDIPSLREVWGDAATFVDPDDDEALEAALWNLIADRSELRRAGNAARARAASYTPSRTAAEYLDVYQSLLVSNTAGGRR